MSASEKKTPLGSGYSESVYYSKYGPESNGAQQYWAQASNDTTDGGELHVSAGVLALSLKTPTPVYLGGSLDVLTTSGDIVLTNAGASIGASATVVAVGGSVGATINNVDINVSGSYGAQVGFQVTCVPEKSFVFDVAFIYGFVIDIEMTDGGKK